nr:hypothetical protein [Tanacetum cinerariifolium]
PANSVVVASSLPAGASYVMSTGVITFQAISSQAAGANGAVTNTFMVVMPTTGSLPITATVTATGESNSDGTISKYTLVSLPDPTQGVLYLSNGSRAAVGDVPANGLYFAPTSGYVGNATFTYGAIDNGSAISNIA